MTQLSSSAREAFDAIHDLAVYACDNSLPRETVTRILDEILAIARYREVVHTLDLEELLNAARTIAPPA